MRVKLSMTKAHRIGLMLILLSGGISILWGVLLGQTVTGGSLDFKAILRHAVPARAPQPIKVRVNWKRFTAPRAATVHGSPFSATRW